MADSIIDKIKETLVGSTGSSLEVEEPVKSRDFSYQGESTPVTLTTDDEAGAVPRSKEDHEHERAISKSEENNNKAEHLNKTIKETTEGYQ